MHICNQKLLLLLLQNILKIPPPICLDYSASKKHQLGHFKCLGWGFFIVLTDGFNQGNSAKELIKCTGIAYLKNKTNL